MRRPNMLILYTDQQRWDALGANGNPDIKTPNLDRLATQGVNFDHHFVQSPVCMPSRASFLTGQYPSTLGITHMGVPVPPETVTLPRLLTPYGYRTGNIGKLHFLPHANRDHREPYPEYGFDCLEISDEPGCYEDAYRAWVRAQAPEQLDEISIGVPPSAVIWRETMGVEETVVHPPERFPKEALTFRADPKLTHTAFVADQAMAFIDRERAGPWCCVAGFYAPHSPWIAPREFLDVYDPASFTLIPTPSNQDDEEARGKNRDSLDAAGSEDEIRAAHHGYYAMVSEVDHHVGRILDHLEASGMADETIVVFTSDHGEWLGEHRRYGKGYPGDDSVSRVPLVVSWPGHFSRTGRTVSEIVEAVDVLPTLLECAAIQRPPRLQGESLVPLLTGVPAAGENGTALMEHRGWKNLRTERFRYVIEADGQERLFDLQCDPKEYDDVAGEQEYAADLAEMRRRLIQRLIEIERPLARTWTY